ncbi:winged helix-turn-helix domain-containing protein [Terrabacter carboxydivorans]|uniref:winged helix-turn-helix domain-containing protein n=1 Tax=Terrabacter carboxydivorans TaxID=619730 RepID=UPI0031D3CBBB
MATRAGTVLPLTAHEFAILHFLVRHAGDVVSRAQILDNVWDPTFEGGDNIVEVYIGHSASRSRRSLAGRPPGRRHCRLPSTRLRPGPSTSRCLVQHRFRQTKASWVDPRRHSGTHRCPGIAPYPRSREGHR